MAKSSIAKNSVILSNSYVRIGEKQIPYKIRFSKKSTYLSLHILDKGFLLVVIPRGASLKDAESFIIAKSDWILKHFRPAVKSMSPFLLFGKEVKIEQQFDTFISSHNLHISEDHSFMKITSPSGSKIPPCDLFRAWLRHYAKIYIKRRVHEFANKYDFKFSRIFIRAQKTRWGTCSRKGNLSFNFRLMHFRKEIIDYVIIHELCHLKELNHSPKFWELVKTYIPDYKELRKELRNSRIEAFN